VMWRL